MSEVCHEPFWNYNYSWNSPHPELSNCFEQVILIGVPSAILWLMIPLQLYSLPRSGARTGRWTKLTIAKMILTVFLIVVELLDMIYSAQLLVRFGDVISTITIIGPLVQIVTFILVMVYVDLDRRKGRLSNPLLFVYWFLLTISGIILFRTKFWRSLGFLPHGTAHDVMFRLFVHEVWFPIVFLQLILSCWADTYTHRLAGTTKNPSPENDVSFLNKMCGIWIYDLLRQGWKRVLTNDDIWDLRSREKSENMELKLEEKWVKQFKGEDVMDDILSVHNDESPLQQQGPTKAEKKVIKNKPSLALAIYKVVWTQFWKAAMWKFIYDMCVVVVIVLVGAIISFTAHPREYAWRGYVYTLFIVLASLLQTVAMVNFNFINLHQGMNARAALSAMLFRKILRLSNTSRSHFAVGNVTNLLTADMQRITGFLFNQVYLWVTPISVVIMLMVLWAYIGVASLAGLATVFFLIGVQLFLVGRSRAQEAAAMRYKDVRQRTINEIFNEIKILKMYAWEHQFEERAVKMRQDELGALNRASLYSNINMALTFVTPPLAALVTYATYLFVDPNNVLDPGVAFVTLLFLFSIRPSLHMMPQAASLFVQAKLATDRMAAFFLARELDKSAVVHLSPNDHGQSSKSPSAAITITDGSFSWHPRARTGQAPALKDITVTVDEGTLVAIVGGVASGKSSLIAAMLGLMEKISGQVTIKGTVAYVTQNAWIQNLTLRDNILFGKEFDEDLYLKVLDACALRRDLEILTDGDQTEIGEKGINLSGGQKTRVTLARAVYADADIIFLDDPLAAVDAHVGKYIFEHVIGPNGMLHGKTRIFVTNGINWLPHCDMIFHLEQGRIATMGRYEELAESDEMFRKYLQDYHVDPEQEREKPSKDTSGSETSSVDKDRDAQKPITPRPTYGTFSQKTDRTLTKGGSATETTKLIGMEEFREGGVTWQTYKLLAKDMSYLMVAIVFVGYGVASVLFLVSNTWIGVLSEHNYTLADGSVDQGYKSYGLGIYAAYILGQLVFVTLALCGVTSGIIKAGRALHNGMLHRLMRSPMSYFDTTPLGRILNRFSKDIDTVDTTVANYMRYFLSAFYLCVAFMLLIMIEIPLTIVFIIPLVTGIVFAKKFYQSTAMQLTRLDAKNRAPLISSLQQTFSGSSIIVATGQTKRFIIESQHKVDNLSAIIHLSNAARRWISFTCLIISNVLTTIVALFAVFGRDNLPFSNEPARVGLALMSTVTFSIIIQWMIQNLCDLEQALLSTERIRDYTDAPVEAPAIIPDYRPPSKWPSHGNITFTNYETRYRPGLDLVLKGINGTITSGEKIGVVGRTGSGKSSLTLALLRIIEPAGGTILIDGVDVTKIGLHDLRSRITIIPQESALFSGSLRLNVDPTEEADDQLIWDALESSRLKAYFQSTSQGLETPISEGGSNLSVGQRQLICLARALLRRSKILILDEATAAIDFETDKFVQEIVKREFADCTVLTIAHRINTIMDCDRVLVMDAGKILEFDSPANLIQQHDSLFYKLAKTAGAI